MFQLKLLSQFLQAFAKAPKYDAMRLRKLVYVYSENGEFKLF